MYWLCNSLLLRRALIFYPAKDEIDSLLSARKSEGEHESSRRLKTEFLVQMDGVSSGGSGAGRVLLIGATNRPQELDDAAMRRLPKQLYIPLPDALARASIVQRLLDSPHDAQKRIANSLGAMLGC